MAEPDAMQAGEDVCVGSFIRVWPCPSETTLSEAGEWAEVVRSEPCSNASRSLLCETLGGVLFSFVPEHVAQGIDARIAKFELKHEVAQLVQWRCHEIQRLQHAVDEKSGKVGNLPLVESPPLPEAGYRTAASQVRAKATVLCDAISSRRRRAMQEMLESSLERFAHQLYERGSHEFEAVGCCSRNVHRPELCPHCIRKGTWCSGSLHLPDAAARLADAAEAVQGVSTRCGGQGIKWRASDAGVETEFNFGGELVLVQLRPWLFCVSDEDAELFGGGAGPAALPCEVLRGQICQPDKVGGQIDDASTDGGSHSLATSEASTPAAGECAEDSDRDAAATAAPRGWFWRPLLAGLLLRGQAEE
mmetsp:Transcript_11133/g.27870  ORF Transcript_11133/g.27870 Transcript_11133/m.27870 type:complete len:361 (+) Transcript_11133:82-1164(+)